MHQDWNFTALGPDLQRLWPKLDDCSGAWGMCLGLYVLLEKSTPTHQVEIPSRPNQPRGHSWKIKTQIFSRYQKFLELEVASKIIYSNTYFLQRKKQAWVDGDRGNQVTHRFNGRAGARAQLSTFCLYFFPFHPISTTALALQQENSSLSRDTLQLKGDTIRKKLLSDFSFIDYFKSMFSTHQLPGEPEK